MPNRVFTSEQALAMLAAAPTRLADLTTDLTPAQLRTPPAHDEWSANDVLAHLRSCADMWGDAIAVILAEDKPTFRAINPTTWIKQTDYPDLDFQSSFRAFTTQRAELLVVLKSLTPASWARAATVTGAGRPLERSVLDYAERLAVHERPHIKQIERSIITTRG